MALPKSISDITTRIHLLRTSHTLTNTINRIGCPKGASFWSLSDLAHALDCFSSLITLNQTQTYLDNDAHGKKLVREAKSVLQVCLSILREENGTGDWTREKVYSFNLAKVPEKLRWLFRRLRASAMSLDDYQKAKGEAYCQFGLLWILNSRVNDEPETGGELKGPWAKLARPKPTPPAALSKETEGLRVAEAFLNAAVVKVGVGVS